MLSLWGVVLVLLVLGGDFGGNGSGGGKEGGRRGAGVEGKRPELVGSSLWNLNSTVVNIPFEGVMIQMVCCWYGVCVGVGIVGVGVGVGVVCGRRYAQSQSLEECLFFFSFLFFVPWLCFRKTQRFLGVGIGFFFFFFFRISINHYTQTDTLFCVQNQTFPAPPSPVKHVIGLDSRFFFFSFLLFLSMFLWSLFLFLFLSLPDSLSLSISLTPFLPLPPLQPTGCDDPDCCGPAQNGEMERAEKWCDASVPPYETLTIGETSK